MVVDSGITKEVVIEFTTRSLVLELTEPNGVASVEEKPCETVI